MFVISGISLYRESSEFCYVHLTTTLAELKNVVGYTGDFINLGFVKSGSTVHIFFQVIRGCLCQQEYSTAPVAKTWKLFWKHYRHNCIRENKVYSVNKFVNIFL